MRKKVAVLFFIAGLMPQFSFADWASYKYVPLKRTPHFFFRIFSSRPLIAYNSGSLVPTNYLLNYETGEETTLPGSLDPIPFPDEKILSVPLWLAIFDTMEFYSVDKLLQGASHKDAKIYVDKHLPGAYQTMGKLSEDADGTAHYRIVAESVLNHTSGFYTQKYKIKYDQSGQITMKKEGPSKKAQKICEESVQFALPMLSKTGKYLGGVDPRTRNTKIMKVLENGKCEDAIEFGFPTGKVDFSHDDMEVAFHVNALAFNAEIHANGDFRGPAPLSFQHFQKPPKDDNRLKLDVMTFKIGEYLKLKETIKNTEEIDVRSFLKWVSSCEGSNCYYPTYLKNGDLVYLEQNKATGKYQFVFMARDAHELK